MPEDLANDTTISASNDKDLFGIGMAGQGDMGNHFLVAGNMLDLG